MKDASAHDLFKVPDEVIIRELRIELGKSNSYIQELEDKIKSLTAIIEDKDALRGVREVVVGTRQRDLQKTLEKTVQTLRKDNIKFLCRMVQLEKELKILKN